jgi:hypothetical protein
MAGDPDAVITLYRAMSRAAALRRAGERPPAGAAVAVPTGPVHRWGSGTVQFDDGRLESEDGTLLGRVRSGQRVVLRLAARVHAAVEALAVGFIVKQLGPLGGHVIYSTNNHLLGQPLGALRAGDRLVLRFAFQAALLDGHYALHVIAASAATGTIDIFDWINDYVTFSVEGSRCHEGLADLGAEVRCELIDALPAVARS